MTKESANRKEGISWFWGRYISMFALKRFIQTVGTVKHFIHGKKVGLLFDFL